MLANIVIFAFILAPGIASTRLAVVITWAVLMTSSLVLWVLNCLSDPGWLQPRTIYPQLTLIGEDPEAAFDAEQPVESQMVHYDNITEELVGDRGSSGNTLARLELEQNKFNYQRQLITEARNRLNNGGGFVATAGTGGTEMQPLMNPEYGDGYQPMMAAQQAQLERAMTTLRQREVATADSIGRKRQEELFAQGCGEYFGLLEKGDFKQVCVVCRAKREMRSHHCKECGRCVQRLDHHCPWIDNCVGLSNQRSFYWFIVILFCTIVYFYWVVGAFVIDCVLPQWSRGIMENAATIFTKLSSEIKSLLVLVTAAFDLIWVAFVGALVARHTAYMSVNITTYEVLVRPAHVVRRFPKNRGRFWFLQDFGFPQCFRSWVSYWTLSSEYDADDFKGAAPQELGQWTGDADFSRGHASQGHPNINMGMKQVY
jgi:hypothetical protein